MPFNEDLVKTLEKVEDEALRGVLLNEIEKSYSVDVAGIKENRDQLINEKKELKAKYDGIKGSLDSLGDTTVEEVLNKVAELEKTNKELLDNPGDDTIVKQLELKYEKDTALFNAERDSWSREKTTLLAEKDQEIARLNSEINQGLAQRQLVTELERVGVQQDFKDVLTAALGSNVYVETVGDDRKVKIKLDNLPYDINDGIAMWARETGNKKFLGALKNRGAGANGSYGSSSIVDKPFNEMTYEEKTKIYKQDPELFKQLKANAK